MRWWAFSVLALAVLIVVLDHMVLNVALPTLQRRLGAGISELQWIVDAYILTFASLLLTMGALGDRVGHSIMLRVGMSVFGLASLFGAFSDSVEQLVAARVFMGLGGAMIIPATLAIISGLFSPQERGKAIGAWGAMNGLGVVLGPLLGGWLLEHFSWSAVFLINVPIVIIALIAGFFLVPKSRARIKRGVDLPGTFLSAATVFLLVFSIIKGGDLGWKNPLIYQSLVLSLVCGGLFILREIRAKSPMLDLSLFKDPHFSAGGGSIAIMTFAMFGSLFALTLYMQFVKAYSPMETGLRFLPVAVGYALGSVFSNKCVMRWGARSVVAAGFAGMAALAPLMAFWLSDTPFWLIGTYVGLFSFCQGNIMPPALNVVLKSLPQERAGVGSAIGNVSFQVGGALGIAALGSLMGSVYRSQMDTALKAEAALPAQVAQVARESLGGAVISAGSLPEEIGQGLLSLARNSFMDGWMVIFWVICVLGFIGMLFVLRFMPPRHDYLAKPLQR